MKNFRIVFMGTPEFAVATLGSLLMNGYNVVGVVTVPDKPAGRGRNIVKSAVKEFAELSSLPVLQPEKLRDDHFISSLKNLKPDLFIVVAFRMLPEIIWSMPPAGTINLHASLLPHYRGAAPINHVLINGEQKTGVTTFFINDQIDTGNLLLREEIPVFPYENAGDLQNRLMKEGARLMIKTLEGLAGNRLIGIPQSQFLKPGEIPVQAPKIFPGDCIIDWRKDAARINNLVRGLAPAPCARTVLNNGKESFTFKIYESQALDEKITEAPGSIISDGKTYLRVACGKGYLNLVSVQLEGKKRMGTRDFLRGFRIAGFNAEISPMV